MDVVIVHKADGTFHCEARQPIPVEHHAGELRKLGASKICGQGNVKGPGPNSTVCGAPTGRVNAFAILESDWETIASGTVGTLGFHLWQGAPFPDLKVEQSYRYSTKPVKGMQAVSITLLPVLLREIIGRPGRCYGQGEVLSDDFVPDRINIEHDEFGRISDVWVG